MDQTLLYVVTGLGIMLSVFSFVVIFRGQRIPGDTGTAQELEFQGLKLKTNVVVMLLAVSVIVAVLPLLLQAWLSAKAQEISAHQQTAAAPPAPPRELLISLTGQVLDGKNPIEGARVTVLNLKDVKPGDPPPEVAHTDTDANGSFDIQQFPLGEGDRYKVVAAKEGFIEQAVRLGPGGAVIFSTVLVAKGQKTGGPP